MNALNQWWLHRRRPLLVGIALAVAGIAAFYTSFRGVFVYDDIEAIVENPYLAHLWPLSKAMSVPLWNSGRTIDGRPVLSLSFALTRAVFARDPWGYHLGNLVIHVAAGLLLFGLVRRTLRGGGFRRWYADRAAWIALAVSLVWLVHPLQTESVTYIVQRAESMAGLAIVATVYLAMRGMRSAGRAWPWYAGAVAVCLLGMGTKEIVFSAPVLVYLYDVVFVSRSWLGALRRRWPLYVALAATWGLLGYLVAATWGDKGGEFEVVPPLVYARTQPGVILYYLRLVFWPDPLVSHYRWPIAETVGAVAWPLAGVAALAAVTLVGLLKRRWWGFAGAWFFLILAPSSSFAPLLQNIQEHRMYLSLAAVLTVVVAGGAWALRRLTAAGARRRWLPAAGLGVVVAAAGALGWRTATRNLDYSSELIFWAALARDWPYTEVGQYNLGTCLYEKGRYEEAYAAFRKALEINPTYGRAYNNVGVYHMDRNEFEEAAGYFAKAVTYRPKNYTARYNLGKCLQELGRPELAAEQLAKAIELRPRSSEAHNSYGVTLVRLGRYDEAVDQFNTAIRVGSDEADPWNNLGIVHERKGENDEAADCFRKALDLDPDFVKALINLSAVLPRIGRPDEAIAAARRAIELDPDEAFRAHYNIATVLRRRKQRAEAISHLQACLRIKPDYENALVLLGVMYEKDKQYTQAAACLRRALEVNPDRRGVRLELAQVLLRLSRTSESIALLQQAVRDDPEDAEAHGLLAAALKRGGDSRRAAYHRQLAQELGAAPTSEAP